MKETVDPQIIEQLDPIARKYEEAVNNNVAALFTEGRGFCHGQRTLFMVGRQSRNFV